MNNSILMARMYTETEQAERSIREKEDAIAKLLEEKEHYEEVYLSFNNENQGGIACSFPLYINKIAEISDKINKYQDDIKVLKELLAEE